MLGQEQRHATRIHIDQNRHESPNPTTGEALYRLGEVVAGMTLYREVSGDEEDVAISRGSETVQLRQDEHFHSGPPQKLEVRIFVNGRPREVSTKEVVSLKLCESEVRGS
jgi:hypothetical protein